ncbi:hypothetical protein [uncultured Erythrobacter sp.]|uniref:hypothetical protein n=1 Tax=uncultured Erythrobacter sp. TaxID=263913 RepID=UPI00262BAED3|nr:hypothetical protein [uncultured Erythrobacter sp.]
MPIHESVMMVLVMAILSLGAFATIHSFLAHRRKMAEIKHGSGRRDLEKEELRETVELMQDRLAVLESIAIDPARRTADQIEQLR